MLLDIEGISFRGMFVTFIVLFLCVNTFAVETEDQELLASFDAARQTWLQDAAFYGHYTFKQTGFYSEDEAWTNNIAKKYTVASGIICKFKNKYRLQVNYTKGPIVQSSADDYSVVSNRSIDTIANNRFYVHFYPEQGADFLADGSLNKRSAYSITNIFPELQTTLSPFSLFLDSIAEISSSVPHESRYTITQIDKYRELLSFTGKNAVGNMYIKEVIIRTNEKIPVIEQSTTHRFENESSNMPLTSGTVKVLKWKLCSEISVPYIIRAVSGPLHAVNIPKDTWLASEWRSEDLGNRPPTDADFILQLPPDVGLAGMNHYPKDGLVDIDAITDEDFITENDNTYYGQETWPKLEDSQKNGISIYRWIAAIAGIILIVWGLYRLSKKEK